MLTFEDLTSRRQRIAVVGLGYVGLPLAVALARHFDVLGFDISAERVRELSAGSDRTREVEAAALAASTAAFTCDPEALRSCRLFIVAVPTPIDEHLAPDLRPVIGASRTVGRYLPQGSVVAYESTVYPGLTEDVCVPLLEEHSGLKLGEGFSIGYSPERINPGDKVHTLETIVKVVSASDQPTLDLLAAVYGSVVTAGVHLASSIKVAEAAKVIENTQRDLNIALMNELSLIFDRMGIDTLEVLQAAGTKWNFLPFRPGLVGGHCIGVDPYYLTYKAQAIGHHPAVILSGRRINDGMAHHVAMKAVKLLAKSGRPVAGARIGVLGLTFKEDVPDLRNTKVVDIVRELEDFGCEVLVHDPYADTHEAVEEYGIHLAPTEQLRNLDAVVLAVAHDAYKRLTCADFRGMQKEREAIVLDLKGILDPTEARESGLLVWRL